jgi:cysteine synthase A
MAVESLSTPPLRVASDITQLVGHTPMLQLSRVVAASSAAVFAKLEFLNPGGSIKDRAALGMILDAEARGCYDGVPRSWRQRREIPAWVWR